MRADADTTDSGDLAQARAAVFAAAGIDLSGYSFHPVDGAFQATVWKLIPKADAVGGALVLRLTPKPVALIRRIGRIVDTITTLACSRTLAAAPVVGGMTAHLATWLPEVAPHQRISMHKLGWTVARLHAAMAAQSDRLADRPLTFDLRDTADSWSLARQHWVRGRRSWPLINGPGSAQQPIHGDTHSGNYLHTAGDQIGFIDFDKMMCANPVFDLARIIDSTLFRRTPSQAEFDTESACDLLAAYFAPDGVAETTVTALEGLTVMINEATGILSQLSGDPARRNRAEVAAQWWLQRADDPDPMGIRARLAQRGLLRKPCR